MNKEWLREGTKPGNHGLVGGAVADATRNRLELMLENALLRQHRSGAAGEAPTAELEDLCDLTDWLLDDLE